MPFPNSFPFFPLFHSLSFVPLLFTVSYKLFSLFLASLSPDEVSLEYRRKFAFYFLNFLSQRCMTSQKHSTHLNLHFPHLHLHIYTISPSYYFKEDSYTIPLILLSFCFISSTNFGFLHFGLIDKEREGGCEKVNEFGRPLPWKFYSCPPLRLKFFGGVFQQSLRRNPAPAAAAAATTRRSALP